MKEPKVARRATSFSRRQMANQIITQLDEFNAIINRNPLNHIESRDGTEPVVTSPSREGECIRMVIYGSISILEEEWVGLRKMPCKDMSR